MSPITKIRKRSRAAAAEAAATAPSRTNAPEHKLAIDYVPIEQLKPAERRLRKHSDKQMTGIRASIIKFGANTPIVVDDSLTIIDGEAIHEAMKDLGFKAVPILKLSHLSPAELRLYRIAVNKLGEATTWDNDLLQLELVELEPFLLAEEIAPELLGFSSVAFDNLMLGDVTADAEGEPAEVEPAAVAVSRLGDLWALGPHRLICGNALEAATYIQLMEGEKARMVFTDCPFNVPVNGHVSGLGKVKHREFAMASGEMSDAEFTVFLKTYMQRLIEVSVDGAIHFHCMDWRHIAQLINAGEDVYESQLKQLIVWNKSNAGMGTFYRSQHELIAVFKAGSAPHTNTFELGQSGRYRTNVWDYPGANSFRKGRNKDLSDHPTVKPTVMVMDAIKDVSHQGEIVLDCFSGSGTTLLAAEKTRRRARVVELDPLYVDVAIRRYEDLTGQQATLTATGQTFADVAAERLAALPDVPPDDPNPDRLSANVDIAKGEAGDA